MLQNIRLQNIRFIGGTKNLKTDAVAPSTDVIGTDMTVSLQDRPLDRDFKKGDRLLCVKSYPYWLTEGHIYEATFAGPGYNGRAMVHVVGDKGSEGGFEVASGYFKLNESAPKGDRYTRRRLVINSPLSKYEETCFVLDSMSDEEACVILAESIVDKRLPPVISVPPRPVTTKDLPSRASSLIHKLRYDTGTGTLDVTFKAKGAPGDTYRYTGVPLAIVGALVTADSLGSAYTRLIRNKYPCKRIG